VLLVTGADDPVISYANPPFSISVKILDANTLVLPADIGGSDTTNVTGTVTIYAPPRDRNRRD